MKQVYSEYPQILGAIVQDVTWNLCSPDLYCISEELSTCTEEEYRKTQEEKERQTGGGPTPSIHPLTHQAVHPSRYLIPCEDSPHFMAPPNDHSYSHNSHILSKTTQLHAGAHPQFFLWGGGGPTPTLYIIYV
jgi:hypothetical protein